MRDLGDLAGAKAALERALKIDEANSAPTIFGNVAIRVNNLGEVLGSCDPTARQAAYERALKIDEATFGLHHPEVATDINNLGVVLHILGDPRGAKAAHERALKIDEMGFGPDHPSVARD